MSEKTVRLERGVIDMIYPVGSIYMSVNATSPASLFGGTWEQIKDEFLLAAGDSYTAGSTGGEAKHTLTHAEIPNGVVVNAQVNKTVLIVGSKREYVNLDSEDWVLAANNDLANLGQLVSPNQPHNNMPPYLTVYMWKRTA